MKPNNLYYRDIAIIVTGGDETAFPKFYSSMYYMRKIAEEYKRETYTTVKSSNKYLRDWYVELTGDEPPATHKYNLWYLRKIAKAVYPSAENNLNENQCLHIIADNITIGKSVKLSVEPSTQSYGEDIVATATLLDENREPIQDAVMSFYDGETYLGSGYTDSSGKESYYSNELSIGTHTLRVVADDYDISSSSVTVTITKIPSTLTASADYSTRYVGQDVTISGVLSVGSSKTVKLYNGNTLIDDNIITGTDGAYTKTVSPSVGVYSYNVRYDGDDTHSSVISDSVPVVVQSKLSTILTIDTPTLIYSDEFSVTGTLTENNGSTPISGATITLAWNDGSDHTTTATTGSNGKVTFSTLEATTISEYTFQLQYNGDTSHNSTTSSEVAVTPSKETSVLNITAPSNNASVTGSTMTVTGTLKDNDDEVMASKTVKVKLGSTTLGTLTSDSSGNISGTVSTTGLSDGSNTIRIIFEEDSYYEESYVDRTISLSTWDDMSLSATDGKTSTPCILSYADYSAQSNTEYVTVTAQLLNGSSSATISNVPVVFGVYDSSDNLIGTTTTENTNASGQASYTYTTQGLGDVYVKAVPDNRSLLSETFVVEDCWAYHTTVTDSDSHFTKYNWGSNWYYLSDYEVPVGYKVIMKSNTNIQNGQLGLGSSSGNYFAIQPENSKIYVYASTSSQTNVNFPTSANEIIYELVDSQTAKLYVDNTLVGTYTPNSNINRYIKAVIYSGNVYDMDYVKIKPL